MSNKQQQSSGSHSVNVQAAGSVQILQGQSYADVKQIANEIFAENFLKLRALAKETAEQRAEEIVSEFIKKLQDEAPARVETFKDPDMLIALFKVQQDYARSGKKELADLLVNLLVQRTQVNEEELQKIVLNESLTIAPKITKKQLNLLSIRFLLGEL